MGTRGNPEKGRRKGRLTQLLGRVGRYFSRDLWQVDLDDLPTSRRLFSKFLRFLALTVREFSHSRCLFRASALSFITVLTLVPALALAFSLMKGFGAYDYLVETAIDPGLDQLFGPASGSVRVHGLSVTPLRSSVDHLLRLAQQTDVFGLGLVGLLLLLYMVVQLLSSVEEAFNQIWGVPQARSVGRKLTDYLALFVMAPLFILAATAITAAAQNNAAVMYLREQLHLGSAVELLLRLVPLVAGWLALTILYMVMPNQRIPVWSALVGGVLGGTIWQVIQWLHVHFQIGVANYNAIYAGFAAIPIFLAWIFLSWVAVLLGGVMAFAHQTGWTVPLPLISRRHPMVFSWRLALSVTLAVAEAFGRGEPPPSEESISRSLRVPSAAVRSVLSALVSNGVLLRATRANRNVYLPAKSLERITLHSVLEVFTGALTGRSLRAQGRLDPRADEALAGWLDAMEGSDYNRTLADLVAHRATGDTEGGEIGAARVDETETDENANLNQADGPESGTAQDE